jgi:hypothetical protein
MTDLTGSVNEIYEMGDSELGGFIYKSLKNSRGVVHMSIETKA